MWAHPNPAEFARAPVASEVHLLTFRSQTPRCPFCVDRGQLDEELGISASFISAIVADHQRAYNFVNKEAKCQNGPSMQAHSAASNVENQKLIKTTVCAAKECTARFISGLGTMPCIQVWRSMCHEKANLPGQWLRIIHTIGRAKELSKLITVDKCTPACA